MCSGMLSIAFPFFLRVLSKIPKAKINRCYNIYVGYVKRL